MHFMVTTDQNFVNAHHMTSGSEDDTLGTISILLAVLSALCLVGMVVALIRRSAVTPGRPAAEAVWRRGWYCTRCALVHFAPGEEPPGVLYGQVLDPYSFRSLVWTTGGYGNRLRPGAF